MRRNNKGGERVAVALSASAVALGLTLAPHAALAEESSPMYRLYNQYNGDHMYTLDESERDDLVGRGWNEEGVAWDVPDTGDPVWRLYNPYTGEHLFTLNEDEYDSLQDAGWNGEGVGFRSAGETGTPIYRLYNRWLSAGTHLYTTDPNEYDSLRSLGWNGENVAFYGSVDGNLDNSSHDITLQGKIRVVRHNRLLQLLGITHLDNDSSQNFAVLELDHARDIPLPNGDVIRGHRVSFILLPDSFAIDSNRDRTVTLNFARNSLSWSLDTDLGISLPRATSGVSIIG